jgi:general secretion pathway protein G
MTPNGDATLVRQLGKLAMLAIVLWGLVTYWPVARAVATAPFKLAEGAASAVEMHQFQKMIMVYFQRESRFPTLAEFNQMIAESLQSSIKDPSLDAWRHPYYYFYNSRRFEIRSGGPDGRLNTSDDLVVAWER